MHLLMVCTVYLHCILLHLLPAITLICCNVGQQHQDMPFSSNNVDEFTPQKGDGTTPELLEISRPNSCWVLLVHEL